MGDIGFDLGVVEGLLRECFGSDVALTHAQQIRPWTVARCHLDGAQAPRTVVVKWLRSNPEGFRVERSQVATEVAALGFVAEVAPGVSPSLIAWDGAHDLLVTEDLAPRRTLHSMLSSGIATHGGVAGLHTFAATMACLHAATATLDVDGSWNTSARVVLSRDRADRLLDRLDGLVPLLPRVRVDVNAALGEVEDPRDFAAFSNGDSGANNCLVDADGADGRMIDFERACRRHVLIDVVALHVPGSMWMTVADPVPLGVEATYRQVAGAAMPAVLDDASYGFGLSAACAIVALEKLDRFEKLDGREPGHHSRPQLVTTIERTVETMRRSGQLEMLTSWFAAVARALRKRWPNANITFPDDYTLREPFEPDH